MSNSNNEEYDHDDDDNCPDCLKRKQEAEELERKS